MIKIMIADDQALMRDGLKTIIELEEDMQVVATAANGEEAYNLTAQYNPDVILMDIRMPIMDGVEGTRIIKRDFPKTVVIVLTTFNDDEYIINALAHGANGYFLKDIEGDRLLEIIRKAMTGDMVIPQPIAARLAHNLTTLVTTFTNINIQTTELSLREREIAELMIKYYSNSQIATQLYLTEGTVKNYISEIYSKLGVNNRNKAIEILKNILAS